ncbi:ABC transporter permease [Nocardioides guangzhouensis]|uniref:ABC transporter permease n=1 Tax=Nocardioides guangzhouensis TaxID=2497878 RepID=A0A4Q4ZFM5_9ACTN|nr:ABC transporter permease [Nocardioides guangzhouensis]RYP86211.1 ABC transporter permease [Nocardioides guangzhouensis]
MNPAKRIGLAVAAPVLAFAIAGIFASALLAVTGNDVAGFWDTMLTWPENRQLVNILNQTGILYLSGLAAAIGFRMNLFNIGVEGQYRIGTFVAAVVAGEAWLPGKANTLLAIVLAMVAGALWAGIAGLLRVTRGVSEVISTIMLNSIAGLLVGYLVAKVGVTTGVSTGTKTIPEESWVGGIQIFGDTPTELYGLVLLAIVAGVAFHVMLNNTTFGFNLRATGRSESAAVAAGVDVKRMVVTSMLLSGAVAGLIGMPVLFGQAHNYGTSFQLGIGFAGIAVALLGRNHPVGIALGALVFSFLAEQGNVLNILVGVSPDIVAVTQGIILLAVVIAYEFVRRYRLRLEQSSVAEQVAGPATEEAKA